MKKFNHLEKQYDSLTVVERVDLYLAAHMRDDEAQQKALEWDCPSADFFSFTFYLLALRDLATMLVIGLLADLTFIMAMATGIVEEWERGATPASGPELARLWENMAVLWSGFVACCEYVGHDPEHVLNMAPIPRDENSPARFVINSQIKSLKSITRDEPDPYPSRDKVRACRDAFLVRLALCGELAWLEDELDESLFW
jgi:hypothetical protein